MPKRNDCVLERKADRRAKPTRALVRRHGLRLRSVAVLNDDDEAGLRLLPGTAAGGVEINPHLLGHPSCDSGHASSWPLCIIGTQISDISDKA
jgi:hypothetical protein